MKITVPTLQASNRQVDTLLTRKLTQEALAHLQEEEGRLAEARRTQQEASHLDLMLTLAHQEREDLLRA